MGTTILGKNEPVSNDKEDLPQTSSIVTSQTDTV